MTSLLRLCRQSCTNKSEFAFRHILLCMGHGREIAENTYFMSPFLIRSSDDAACLSRRFKIDDSSFCNVTRFPRGVYSYATLAAAGFGGGRSKKTFNILTITEHKLCFIIVCIKAKGPPLKMYRVFKKFQPTAGLSGLSTTSK